MMKKCNRLVWGMAALWVLIVTVGCAAQENQVPKVVAMRVPANGIQPQVAVDDKGVVNLIYYKGDPQAGDVFYVRSTDDGKTFSAPIRVNSQRGSAIAAGNIRGAQLALGKNGRVHVAWNGSGKALPKGLPNPDLPDDSPYKAGSPMLYSRLNDAGTAFEPQRNLMQRTFNLDGGGSVAADQDGYVYVAWHGNTGNEKGEGKRRLWITRSTDGGQTFSPEVPAWNKPTGACGCCGVRIATDKAGNVEILYRSATEVENRDTYLLRSKDHGQTFDGVFVHPWKIDACPMSSFALADGIAQPAAAWESAEQVYYASYDPATLTVARPTPAPGNSRRRKYPVLATNARGDVLLAWGEGMGWAKGGSVAWQAFDKNGQASPEAKGRLDGVPAWSLVAAFTNRNGDFTVLY